MSIRSFYARAGIPDSSNCWSMRAGIVSFLQALAIQPHLCGWHPIWDIGHILISRIHRILDAWSLLAGVSCGVLFFFHSTSAGFSIFCGALPKSDRDGTSASGMSWVGGSVVTSNGKISVVPLTQVDMMPHLLLLQMVQQQCHAFWQFFDFSIRGLLTDWHQKHMLPTIKLSPMWLDNLRWHRPHAPLPSSRLRG